VWDLFFPSRNSHPISCFDLGPVFSITVYGTLGKGAEMHAMLPLRSGFFFGRERCLLQSVGFLLGRKERPFVAIWFFPWKEGRLDVVTWFPSLERRETFRDYSDSFLFWQEDRTRSHLVFGDRNRLTVRSYFRGANHPEASVAAHALTFVLVLEKKLLWPNAFEPCP
jgi:hypothetical protein